MQTLCYPHWQTRHEVSEMSILTDVLCPSRCGRLKKPYGLLAMSAEHRWICAVFYQFLENWEMFECDYKPKDTKAKYTFLTSIFR